MQVYFCEICGRRMSDVEIERGEGLLRGQIAWCPDCMDKAPPAPGGAAAKRGAGPRPRRTRRPPTAQMHPSGAKSTGNTTLVAFGGGIAVALIAVLAVVLIGDDGQSRSGTPQTSTATAPAGVVAVPVVPAAPPHQPPSPAGISAVPSEMQRIDGVREKYQASPSTVASTQRHVIYSTDFSDGVSGWSAEGGQEWMLSRFSRRSEDGRTYVRVTNAPASLYVKRSVSAGMRKVELLVEKRLSGIGRGENEWDVPYVSVDFFDPDGKGLSDWHTANWFEDDCAWDTFRRVYDVPDNTATVNIAMGFKAESGTADFSLLTLAQVADAAGSRSIVSDATPAPSAPAATGTADVGPEYFARLKLDEADRFRMANPAAVAVQKRKYEEIARLYEGTEAGRTATRRVEELEPLVAGRSVQPLNRDIVVNGGFESIEAGGLPTGWSTEQSDLRIVEEDGDRHVRFTTGKALIQDVPLDPGWKRVRVSARMKVTGYQHGDLGWSDFRISLRFENDSRPRTGDTSGIINLTGDSDWTTLTQELLVPDDAQRLNLEVATFAKAGVCEIDDVSVMGIEAR